MITKEIMKEGNRAWTIRKNLENAQKALTNDQFLDSLTVSFLLKEADIELLLKLDGHIQDIGVKSCSTE